MGTQLCPLPHVRAARAPPHPPLNSPRSHSQPLMHKPHATTWTFALLPSAAPLGPLLPTGGMDHNAAPLTKAASHTQAAPLTKLEVARWVYDAAPLTKAAPLTTTPPHSKAASTTRVPAPYQPPRPPARHKPPSPATNHQPALNCRQQPASLTRTAHPPRSVFCRTAQRSPRLTLGCWSSAPQPALTARDGQQEALAALTRGSRPTAPVRPAASTRSSTPYAPTGP